MTVDGHRVRSGREHVRVAVFAPAFPPAFRGGGPIRSLQAMVAQAPESFRPFVLTPDRDLGSAEPLPVPRNTWVSVGRGSVYYASLGSPVALLRAFRELRARRPELLYFSSFFNPLLTILPVLLWRVGFWGRPILLLAPRGEFGVAALSRRPGKKKLYLRLFRLLGVHRSVIWHSTAEHETADIRRLWGPSSRIVFRENATLLPTTAMPAMGHPGPLRAVFLARIVEHKGLRVALEALRDCTGPVVFDIFGSREDPVYFALCEALAHELPENVTATFHGEVPADEVVTIFAQHDALILPTAGENFGHVIAEALSCSCIVVTTVDTPWTQTLSAGGGVVVPGRSPRLWTEAIDELARLDSSHRVARRRSAGAAYTAWATRPEVEHLWSLAMHE